MNAIDTTGALAAFRANAMCHGLDDAACRQLFALAEPVAFAAGARLVRQGEVSRGAFVLRTGKCEARVSLPAGGEQTLAILDAGSMFGEMSLLEHGHCSASVVAVEPVEGWFIERDPFRALTAGRNATALSIQRTITMGLVSRLGALNHELRKHPAPEDRPVEDALPETVSLASLVRHPATGPSAFDHRGFLRILPFFADFTPDEIDASIAAGSVIEVPRGQWLFVAGNAADACYLVVRGAVEANARIDGHERRIALLGPGMLVGFMSVLAGTAHGANARARENASLLEFPAAHFLALYNGTSGAAVKMQHAIHRNLLQSLARSNSQLSRLVTQARLDEVVKNRVVGS